jgi:uroporphyrinogen decarboxylase
MLSPFMEACHRRPVDRTPVWFMRQAGRYLPEYRKIRASHSILELCKKPELAAEVTLQPVEILGVDAAIIFADLLLPLEPMGLHLDFVANEGPVIHNPVRSRHDVQALEASRSIELSYVGEAIGRVRAALEGRVPVIGFVGAPFTLASYMIEGGGSRHYVRTKRFMYEEPAAWQMLLEKINEMVVPYAAMQVVYGADVVQVFDSWVGALSPGDYEHYVLPHSQTLVRSIQTTGVPVIHFATGAGTFLPLLNQAGANVMGLDWRVNLDEAWAQLKHEVAVQGNLDPVALFAPLPELRRRMEDVLRRSGDLPGYIFNLGHGILPETPVDNVKAVVQMVHEFERVTSTTRAAY